MRQLRQHKPRGLLQRWSAPWWAILRSRSVIRNHSRAVIASVHKPGNPRLRTTLIQLASTVLPETGDRPGSGSIRLFMAGVVSRKWRGLALAPISYAKSAVCAISANLRCIMRARTRASLAPAEAGVSRAGQDRRPPRRSCSPFIARRNRTSDRWIKARLYGRSRFEFQQWVQTV